MSDDIKYFGVFHEDRTPVAFYTDDVWAADQIPADAVEMSEAQWLEFLANPGARRWSVDGPEPYTPPAPPPVAPGFASRLGLKRAFVEQGAWNAVKAALAADPDLQEDWDLATEIRRSDPLTQAMIAQLGLTPAQVDALLIRATELVA